MKKLKIDDLRVESFATTPMPRLRGTVRAHATEDPGCTYYGECPPEFSRTCFDCTPFCTGDFGCSHDCNSLVIVCSETVTHICEPTCDPYVCSDNVTCPWGYPTCNERCG